jgi:hypothetical protein
MIRSCPRCCGWSSGIAKVIQITIVNLCLSLIAFSLKEKEKPLSPLNPRKGLCFKNTVSSFCRITFRFYRPDTYFLLGGVPVKASALQTCQAVGPHPPGNTVLQLWKLGAALRNKPSRIKVNLSENI